MGLSCDLDDSTIGLDVLVCTPSLPLFPSLPFGSDAAPSPEDGKCVHYWR